MRALLLALVVPLLMAANSSGPAPLPDASPLLRGVVNTGAQQFKGAKTDSDVHTVVSDAGTAYASSCVSTFADLRTCPPGNGLQCVLDAGWYACQPDAGWAQLGSGTGAAGVTGVSASAPITSSGGLSPTIGCTPASATVGGCLSASAQPIGGSKTFVALLNATSIDAGYVYAPNAQLDNVIVQDEIVSIIDGAATTGIGLRERSALTSNDTGTDFLFGTLNPRSNGFLLKLTNQFSPVFTIDYLANLIMAGNLSLLTSITSSAGNTLLLRDSRAAADIGSSFSLTTTNIRTAGYLVQVNNQATNYFSLDTRGNLYLNGGGTFVDNSGISSHVSITSAADFGVVAMGRHTEQVTDYQPDGGRPAADGGTWVQTLPDGGTYYFHASHHGEFVAETSGPMYGGWLAEFHNGLTGTATDARAFIDYNGGFGQLGGLSRSQFGTCPEQSVPSTGGTLEFEQGESTIMYGIAEHEWFWCNGTNWQPFANDTTTVHFTAMPGSASGWYQGTLFGHGISVVRPMRLQYAIAANQVAGRVGFYVSVAGTTGGTFSVELFDTTTSASLCAKSSISCTTAIGDVSAACPGGVGHAAAGDDLVLRIDTTNCTGTNPVGTAYADW